MCLRWMIKPFSFFSSVALFRCVAICRGKSEYYDKLQSCFHIADRGLGAKYFGRGYSVLQFVSSCLLSCHSWYARMTVKEGNLGIYASKCVCIHALRVKAGLGDVCMLGAL